MAARSIIRDAKIKLPRRAMRGDGEEAIDDNQKYQLGLSALAHTIFALRYGAILDTTLATFRTIAKDTAHSGL